MIQLLYCVKHTDVPYPLRLLRPRRERPRRRAAEQRDELAPFHGLPNTKDRGAEV
jgi:hypothetical protein